MLNSISFKILTRAGAWVDGLMSNKAISLIITCAAINIIWSLLAAALHMSSQEVVSILLDPVSRSYYSPRYNFSPLFLPDLLLLLSYTPSSTIWARQAPHETVVILRRIELQTPGRDGRVRDGVDTAVCTGAGMQTTARMQARRASSAGTGAAATRELRGRGCHARAPRAPSRLPSRAPRARG